MMGNSMSKEQKDEIKRKDRERKKASKEAAKLKEQNTVKPSCSWQSQEQGPQSSP